MQKRGTKRKWRKLALLLFCLLSVQVLPVQSVLPAQAAEAAKSGLIKEKGNYYFYNASGGKIKNKWKKIKGSYYYFGPNGAAYKGKKEMGLLIPAVKTIGGKKYGFDAAGKRLSGTYVKGGIFYTFRSGSGVYDAAVTKKLRKASASGKPAAALKTLLKTCEGKPLKEETVAGASCYGDGKDMLWHYKNFIVGVFRPTKGKEVVTGIMAK